MIEKEKKGKNLFEVNGIKYIDNIPKDMRISLTKEQYAEYLQQEELIEKLQKEIEELKEQKEIDMYLIGDSISKEIVKRDYIPKDKIREKIKELEEYIVKTEEETCGRCITIGEDMTIRYLKELLEEE